MITDEIFAQLKTVDRKLTENEFTTKYLKPVAAICATGETKAEMSAMTCCLICMGSLQGMGMFGVTRATESNQRLQTDGSIMAEFHLALAGEVVRRLLERAGDKTKGADRLPFLWATKAESHSPVSLSLIKSRNQASGFFNRFSASRKSNG